MYYLKGECGWRGRGRGLRRGAGGRVSRVWGLEKFGSWDFGGAGRRCNKGKEIDGLTQARRDVKSERMDAICIFAGLED